jgi:hypothetical protein
MGSEWSTRLYRLSTVLNTGGLSLIRKPPVADPWAWVDVDLICEERDAAEAEVEQLRVLLRQVQSVLSPNCSCPECSAAPGLQAEVRAALALIDQSHLLDESSDG